MQMSLSHLQSEMVNESRAGTWKRSAWEGDVRPVSYYLTHADHTDKWLKHKPAEKTNKTLFS